MIRKLALLLVGIATTLVVPLATVPAAAHPATSYYTGDYKISLELYSFNANLNAYDLGRKGAPPLAPLDAIKWAKTAGFDAVDVTAYYLPGYSGTTMPTKPTATIMAFADQVKALTKQLGLTISGTGIGNDFANPDPSAVALDVRRAEFWVNVAAEMGAPIMRVFSGAVPSDIGTSGWASIAQHRIVPALQQVAAYAATKGVKIGLQNHGDMTATAAQTIQIDKWVNNPNLVLIDDTGYFQPFQAPNGNGYPWYSDIGAVLPYSGSLYLKLKPDGEDSAGPMMNFTEVFTEMRQSGYTGDVPLERLWAKTDPDNPKNQKTPPYTEVSQFLTQVRAAEAATKNPPPGS
ncbi:MAG TPA: sugar phosphate isomerase/epimerase family protein [Pseudonocardiaceae bacterium]|jgi:hypothetical protein